MTNGRRGHWAWACGALFAAAMLVPAVAAASPSLQVAVSAPSPAFAGDTIRVSGAAVGAHDGQAVLEEQTGSRWRRVGAAPVTGSGRFEFALVLRKSSVLR